MFLSISKRLIKPFWRLALLWSLIIPTSAFASDSSDWGYDHVKPPPKSQGSSGLFARPAKNDYHTDNRDTDHTGMSAKAASGDWGGAPAETNTEIKKSATAKGTSAKGATAKSATTKLVPTKGLTAKSEPGNSAKVGSAREFLELASKHKLSPDQANDVNILFAAPQQGDWQKVSVFWPEVKKLVVTDDGIAEDFGYLFRALLRLSCSAKLIPPNQIEVIKAILGPERVAVEGTPPLTEEAVDSYADMACFLYERKNPGKTIDADDNRAVFASVIMGKFKDAPSDQAKRAMANFALTWAKFKVAWDLAPEENRPQLLKELDTASGAAALQTALEKKIFNNGPWTKAL